MVDKINLKEEISNKERRIFWTNNGVPGINLKIIKYSIDELLMYLSILFVYLLQYFSKNLLKKYFDKIKKQKHPKVKLIIQTI